ncbi:MAG: NnrU family protein [Thermodesulfobacteriota bacterium]
MPPSVPAQLFVLGLAWAAWCGLHSLLLADFLRPRLQRVVRLSTSQYRLLYSLFSLITFYPLAIYSIGQGALLPFLWPRPWLWVQLILLSWSGFLLLWSSWSFSQGGFDLFGLSDSLSHQPRPQRLISRGAYAYMRHPMHVSAMIVVWARSHNGPADVLISLLMSVYIALGTWHEENRLRRQFGQAYREYARKVPLVPFCGK